MIRDKTEEVSLPQGFQSYVVKREYSALLRSTGHLIKDGQRVGNDPFHVYRELVVPIRGERQTFQATRWLMELDQPISNDQLETYYWYPCVASGYSTLNTSPSINVPLGDPAVDSFEDYVLELNAQGTKFVKLTRPGSPIANIGQLIGEIHDLPRNPLFLKRKAKEFQDLGSEYLNIEFGWKPFIKDLRKMYLFTKNVNAALDKIRRNNGIRVRRRTKPKLTTDQRFITEGAYDACFGDLSNESIGGSAELADLFLLGPTGAYPRFVDSGLVQPEGHFLYEVSEAEVTEEWCVGTWQYYVPDIGSDQWTRRAVLSLFGTSLTPHLAWELMPWSWLVDWFANVGDILSNLQTLAVDNEVLSNASAMRRIYTSRTVTGDVSWSDYNLGFDVLDYHHQVNISAGATEVSYSFSKETKLRQAANPYGFGVDFSALSLRQKSILAALAISRRK